MKKILIYISFLLISSGALAQAKIGVDGNVIATGNYPVVNSEHVKGGLHDDIQTLAQRNAIPDNFRKIGMLVYVIDSLKYYYLNNGISDASWTELTLGSGGGISPTNQIQNGIISGGTVTWSGTGLTFDITALIYAKNGIIYTISAGQVTLDPSDNTYGRIDLIAADTVANGFLKITGSAGVVPITPQANPESQIALTTGILLNAGSVVPPTITSNVIYDENNVPPEWTVGSQLSITYDKTNTTMPYSGTKDILVSSYTGGTSGLLFTGTVLQTVSQDKVIKFRVKLTGAIPSNNSMRVILYNTITGVLTATTINFQNGYGFSQTNTTDYQNVSIPFSTFASFTGTQFNRLYIYFNGTNTNPFYIDKVEIQDGVPNIPPQTDYSNKLDSVTVVADTLLTTWSKGIGTVKQIFRGLKSYRISSDSSYMIFTYLNGKTDSTQISGGGGGSTPSHDTTVIKAKYPIQFSNVDSTLQFITDSLPILSYGGSSASDTTLLKDSSLIPKSYLNQRIANTPNFANTDLTLNGDRSHHFSNHNMAWDSLGGFSMTTPNARSFDPELQWGELYFDSTSFRSSVYIGNATATISSGINLGTDTSGQVGFVASKKGIDSLEMNFVILPNLVTFYRNKINQSVPFIIKVDSSAIPNSNNIAYFDGDTLKRGSLAGGGSSGSSGDSIISFTKNATKDSMILILKDGRRFAVKDSVGSGGGGGSADVKQTYTGTSTVTIADTTTWLIINPSSLAAAITITMPANPVDKQKIEISFGGTVTGGNGVVNSLTISPNTGQTIIQASAPSYVQSGETISYRYNISNTSYYRIN